MERVLKKLPWLAAFGLTVAQGLVAGAATNAVTAEAPQQSVVREASSDRAAETNLLTMNFRGAPLSLVLDYLSDAAGFIINKEADVKGTVDLWSKSPVTKAEAVELVHSVLKKNGYALVRNGRILTVISLDSAKTADTDIVSGSDATEVGKSDEVVTQIIPIRYASAAQLVNNLQVLLPSSATLSANESANTLILVATKTDVRRMLRIIHLLDNALVSVAGVRVFPLRFADAKQLATVIQQLFSQQSTQTGANNQRGQFPQFGGFGPGGFGPGGNFNPGGGGGQGNASPTPGTGSNTAGKRVTAVADDYSNSLIVRASKELMDTIAGVVEQIDKPVAGDTEIRVFHLVNADPGELAEQLAQLFPEDSRNGNNDNQNQGGFRFGGPGGGGFFGGPGFGGAGQGQNSGSQRSQKLSRVLAVPDPRTSSLIVTASSALMPHIGEMIQRLDSNPARKEVVAIYDLHNANPTEVSQVLQDLFNRNNTMRNNNNNRNSLVGQGDPLVTRETQQQNTGNGNTTFGTGRGGGAGQGAAQGFGQ